MVWLQNKLRLRRGDDAAEEKLGYPKHSWELLFNALRDRIEAGGGRVLIDRPAAKLAPGFVVTPAAPGSFRRGHDPRDFETLEPEHYEAVLATVPSDVFEQMLEPGVLPEAYLAKLRGIEYFTALCLLIELDRQFSPFYWTNIGDDALPFVGLIEHTNLIAPERYGGRRFLYVANYLPRGHELLDLDAEALLKRYTPGLKAVSRGFDRSWVKKPLAAPRAGRPADRHRRLPRQDPGDEDAHTRARSGQHDPDLPRGPRHKLRRPRGRQGGARDVRGSRDVSPTGYLK